MYGHQSIVYCKNVFFIYLKERAKIFVLVWNLANLAMNKYGRSTCVISVTYFLLPHIEMKKNLNAKKIAKQHIIKFSHLPR